MLLILDIRIYFFISLSVSFSYTYYASVELACLHELQVAVHFLLVLTSSSCYCYQLVFNRPAMQSFFISMQFVKSIISHAVFFCPLLLFFFCVQPLCHAKFWCFTLTVVVYAHVVLSWLHLSGCIDMVFLSQFTYLHAIGIDVLDELSCIFRFDSPHNSVSHMWELIFHWWNIPQHLAVEKCRASFSCFFCVQ